MKQRVLIIILLLTLVIDNSLAQNYTQTEKRPISLRDYIDLAIQTDVQVEITQEEINRSEYNLKSIKANNLPTLSLIGSGGYYLGNPLGSYIDITPYAFSSILKLEQTIYGGNSIRNQTKTAKIETLISELNYLASLQLSLYNAKVKYWSMVAVNEQYLVTKRYVEIIKHLFDVINIRFEDGYISRTDLLMVETRLNEAMLQERIAQKNRDIALEEFNNLVSNTALPYFIPSDTLPSGVALPELLPWEFALENRADYLAQTTAIELAEANVKVVRSNYNPRLVVGVQGVYGTVNPNTYNEQIGYGYGYLSFTTSITEFGRRSNSIKRAKQSVVTQELLVEDTKDNIESACRSAWIRVEQCYRERELALANLVVASESLELNTFSYNEGRIAVVDVLSAQLSWIDSYTMAVSSMQSYMVALALYDYTFGL